MERILNEKYNKLKELLKSYESVAIAFSGGVDSTFLLSAAREALGDKAIAITAVICAFPKRELAEAEEFCKNNNIKHFVFSFRELDEIEGFRENPKNRCYLCKSKVFARMLDVAKENGISTLIEGSNIDDMNDYRPGLMAIRELGIKSPLMELKFSKREVRSIAKDMELKIWNKPSFACLASRFAYGEPITEQRLEMVDRAEQLLVDKGFHDVRVRVHGPMARIEVSAKEIGKITDNDIRYEICSKFKSYGFSYIALDLAGYRTGSMNEVLDL